MSHEPLRLNLGSSSDRAPGWTNVDFSPDTNPDIVADVERLPLKDGVACEIWASHILEHLPCGTKALEEWHRVLMPGGVITVAVPDVLEVYMLLTHGTVGVEYFNATIFGAYQTGMPKKSYTHLQAFMPGMLAERMRPLF